MAEASVEELGEAMSAAVRDLTADEKKIAVALYRALADGDPVESETLAGRAQVPLPNVLDALDAWPGVFRDDQGRVVGFWGLAIPKMAHRFHAEGGKPIHAWCAIDPFLVVPAIGRPARVASRDPVTGEPVTMTVTPDGVRDLSPPDAVVSFVPPEGRIGPDVIQNFCHFVLNFASVESGSRWAREREGAILLSTDEAFEVGRRAWRSLREEIEPPTPAR